MKKMNTLEKDGGIDWPIVLFFLLAYAIAWGSLALCGLVARASGIENGITLMGMAEALDFQGHESDLIVPVWLLYLMSRLADFSFTISGIVLIAFTAGKVGLKELFGKLIQWKVPIKWYGVALIPFLIYGFAAALTASGDMAIRESFNLSPDTIRTILFSAQTGILVTFFLRGAMGEELGLRGFALTRLQKQYSPARASLLIGIAWAGWHIPVFIGRDPVSVVAYIALVILLSFIFTWIYNNTRQSLLPVMIFHAAQNSEEIMEVLYPGLINSGWEMISFLGTLLLGLAVTVHIIWKSRTTALETIST